MGSTTLLFLASLVVLRVESALSLASWMEMFECCGCVSVCRKFRRIGPLAALLEGR